MATLCIFCPAELNDETKPEHVLLNALGGRYALRTLDCSKCNNTFGSTIDKALTAQVKEIRNLLQLETGDGRTAPGLKGLQAGPNKIDIAGDGGIQLADKPFVIEQLENGNWNIQIRARSEEHFRQLVPHIAKATGIPEAQLVEQLSRAEATFVSKRPDPVYHGLSFGGPDALRSIVKSALCLWATRIGNDEVRSSAFEASRRFVVAGDETFNRERIHLDSRSYPMADQIKERYGPLVNLIYVRSDNHGRVVGHFTLYNMIAWHMVLAEAGGSPNQKIALVSNPLNPSCWSRHATDEFDVDFAWLDTPDYSDEMTRTKARIVAVMQHYFTTHMPEAMSTIADECIRKLGFEPDQALTNAQGQRLRNYMAQRMAFHHVGMPFEEKLSEEDIARILRS